jgi:hypothetical protein
MSFNTIHPPSQVHSGVQTASTEQLGVQLPPDTSYVSKQITPTDLIFSRTTANEDSVGFGPNAAELSKLACTVTEAFAENDNVLCTCAIRKRQTEILMQRPEGKAMYNRRQLRTGNGLFTCVVWERWRSWFDEHHRVVKRQQIGPEIFRVEVTYCCDNCTCLVLNSQIKNRFPVCAGVDCAGRHST